VTAPRRIIFIAIPIVILVLAIWFGVFSHQTPAGQPPLGELNASSLETLKAEFNRASEQFRIIVLLSPT
jgi:hypothetical protein